MEYIEVSAKSVDEASLEANAQLARDNKQLVEIKVIQEPSSGILGFGKKPAIIHAYYEVTEETIQIEQSDIVENVVESISEEPVVDESVTVATEEDHTDVITEKKSDLTAQEQSIIAEKGKQFLTDIFANMELPVVIEKMTTKDKITFQIHGEDVGILIGKHGQTLDALQYLTNLVANKEVAHRCPVVVDVANYRSRREETLVNLAKRLASKVKHSRHKVSLEPMNAYERKIIHITLQNEPHIVTDSEGEEPYRHVVISYKRK